MKTVSEKTYEKSKINSLTTDLIFAVGLLKQLRVNEVAMAIELLEFHVDCAVSVLGKKVKDLDSEGQQQPLWTLNLVKDYRNQYPRTPNQEIISSIDGGDTIEEATKILADLGK